MGRNSAPRLSRFLPQVVAATLVVAGSPVLAVWGLRATGVVDSMAALVLIGMLLSIALVWAGRRYWERRPAAGDLLFSELMIWGWARRLRIERRLARAMTLLGLGSGSARDSSLDPRQQVRLLEDLANALEARDPYTHGHSRRVARHAAMIAKKMGLSRDEVVEIRTAAAVHDVGKLETPIEILHKPDRLSDEEFGVIKQHPVRGAELVDGLVDDELTRIVRHHHERLDGTGYPGGLAGDQIPLGARIIAVADTFDAITSARPYRDAKPHKQALDILSSEAGTQLDPAAVRAFSSYYAGFRPLALWALVTNFPQRLLYPVASELNGAAGGAASAAKVMAAAAIAAAAGGAAVSSLPDSSSAAPGPATEAASSQPGQAGDPELLAARDIAARSLSHARRGHDGAARRSRARRSGAGAGRGAGPGSPGSGRTADQGSSGEGGSGTVGGPPTSGGGSSGSSGGGGGGLPQPPVAPPDLPVKSPDLPVKSPDLPVKPPDLPVKPPKLPVDTPKLPGGAPGVSLPGS